MSRTIKFRAWDKSKAIWRQPGNAFRINVKNGLVEQNLDDTKNELVLMQFTGLTDKNGTEIYEGDIVKIHKVENDDTWGGLRKGFIEWESAWFTINCNEINVTINQGYDAYSNHLEIIGNRFEHPDLLTREGEV